MRSKSTYFLARTTLHGRLKKEGLEPRLLASGSIRVGKFDWTVTGCEEGVACGSKYLYGVLTKYLADGQVEVVVERDRAIAPKIAPDLVEAKSSFVYLPTRAAIAHLQVWNKIPHEVFRTRLRDLIIASDGFFEDLEIEAIANLDSFVLRASSLTSISEIDARVFPSNPLWGPLWKKLREYIGSRNLSEIAVQERAADSGSIKTALVSAIKSDPASEEPNGVVSESVADQAVLMAAAGYGKGKIVGKAAGGIVTVRTSEAAASFAIDKSAGVKALAEAAHAELDAIEKKDGLSHQ